ncbi:hypothetical protein GLYMA_20G162400v4 [Glycine max]|uniref:uncharacterized protein isoform X3 n=1 Tax=Glycine max TaxID=3847 RepID=UPI0002961D87|nr:uncharacterized protein LOC100801714 isoform X3 [Glycine max]KAG4395097.1 hypothetical protein GLYMA_20G162400v4 [Glycine max]KAH1036399.1 hypothetical protein GYH30_056053 [Glycine max]|eukprot:XP_006606144.1 uncharacterized protein LOC100801714 isoform X3 [Glycine max]
MESREGKSISDLEEEFFHKFRDFMTGITKIDELGIAGSKLLSGFQQALVRSCTHGLCNHISKAKEILNELEGLLGDVTNAIQTTDGNLLALSDLDFDVELNEPVTYNDLEEKDALSRSQSPDVTTTKKKKSIDVPHLAMVMAFIYSMVKQDYLMQEKIVSALDVKMPSEELESYCQMWSLRPFINDEIVHQAWEHIH